MKRADWEKITEEAFASDEIHEFSAEYCRRRAELQGETLMKKRETNNKRRFSISIAATAAALIMIPVGTVGALHFAGGKGAGSSVPGAAVEETSGAASASAAAQEPVVVQCYGEKLDYVNIEYDINYDNVPDIFCATDGGYKFHLNDGQYHTGGISPGGIAKYTDFNGYMEESLRRMDLTYAGTEEYTVNNEGMEWKVCVARRAASNFDSDNDGVVDENWQKGYFDRDVFIKFGDTGYAGSLCVNSDVTAEDLKAFIEGMRLVKLDEPQDYEYEPGYDVRYCVVDGSRVKNDGSEAKIEYYYLPEGYAAGGEYVYYSPDFVKNDNEKISPCFMKHYSENKNEFDCFARNIFDRNSVSSGGEVKVIKDDKAPEQSKTIYINYRKEGPCDGETEEGWELRHENDWYDRDVVVKFDGTGYAVSFCVYHEISDDELMQFIGSMKLVD